jgi:hypothetical protein
MYQKIYFMPKSTGTFADTLAAFGLAAVLREIYEQANGRWSGKNVHIRDVGPYYEVELPADLRPEWIENCPFFAPARPIRTSKQPVSEIEMVWNLDDEWKKFSQFREAQDKLKKTAKNQSANDSQLQAIIEDLRPTPEFWTMAFVGERRMQALPIYNAAILQWHATRDYLAENLKTILNLTASLDSEVDGIAKEWSKKVPVKRLKLEFSASQLFSPTQGQGQNRPKANMLNVRERPQVFWILQFLRAVGLWHCMAPRTVRNGDDRKVYVLSPITLALGTHEKVFQDFAARLWNDTAVKIDISAALLYTETMLEHSQAGQEDELDFEGYGPENVVAGLHVVTYKLLSRNAYTMMNLGFIGLPHWTGEVKTGERAKEIKEVIEEHLDVIRNIDEERSDGYNLLVLYRDFLSGGQLETFFDFAVGYSQYLTHELEQKHFWVKKFTTTNLRRLFMGTDPQLIEILENEGFRNIAYAIRHSTVIPQYLKQKGDTLYDVRYGLGMELKRKAAYPREFVSALGSFIQEYNQENVQKVESKKQPQRRKNIRTNDLDDIVRLVDKFGAELVCNLLVAYGYAGDPREETESA